MLNFTILFDNICNEDLKKVLKRFEVVHHYKTNNYIIVLGKVYDITTLINIRNLYPDCIIKCEGVTIW